jgi:hypothetical protein
MGKEFDPDCAFVEWRGKPEKHRADDVVISPQDEETMRGLVGMANRWRTVRDPSVSGKLEKERLVVSAGAGTSLYNATHSPETLPEFVVTTGEGPKFVVNPKRKGAPAVISSVRKRIDEVKDPFKSRNYVLAQAIVKKLDELVDWEKLREKMRDGKIGGNMSDVFFTLPKNEFPPFGDFGEGGERYTFWRSLCDMLARSVKYDSRLGNLFHYDDLQPRIVGNNIEFHAFVD